MKEIKFLLAIMLIVFSPCSILHAEENNTDTIDMPPLDYFPLEIGYSWEYKVVHYRNNEKHERIISIQITDKIENEDGSTTFLVNGKPYMRKHKDGIFTPGGYKLINLPLTHGLSWESKINRPNMTKTLLVKDTDFTFNLNGTPYNNCIRIISKSKDHVSKGNHVTKHVTFEGEKIYAPNVGILKADAYETSKDNGKRVHVVSRQLISFKTN